MTTTFKLSLQIGATLGRSVKTAIRGSQGQLNQLGKTLDHIKSQQAAVNRFELSEVNVGKARAAYNAATKDVLRLRKEMAKTQSPTKKLAQDYERAKQKTERLSRTLETQRHRLNQSRQALNRAGLSTQALSRHNERLGSTVDRLSRRYQRLDRAMNAQHANRARQGELRGQLFDAVALGAAVVAPINVAVDFEQSIAALGAITRSSDQDMTRLEDTARRLGENTQFSASKAASAMTFLGMAGFNTNQIMAATPGMLNLAQAAGSELGRTADIASNILSGFSLQAQDMGRVGDVLTATFTSSNTTLEMLGNTLKFAAPVASAAGASIEQVAAMAGLLGNVGLQGSMAGTALRATFLRLSAPTGAAEKALADLGIEVADLDGNLRPVPEILKELGQATETLGSTQRSEAIKQIFGEEAAAGATELLKQARSGALDAYIQTLQEVEGAAATMAGRMSSTTQGALKRLGSALESVSISVGSVLLPTIASGAIVLAGLASGVSTLSQDYPVLTKVIVGATVGLIALRVATIAGAFAFTFMKGAVLSVRTAYLTLGAAMALAKVRLAGFNLLASLSAVRLGIVTAAQWAWNAAMTANPIGLMIVAIGVLVGAGIWLVKNWETVRVFFAKLWTGLKNRTRTAVDWLMSKIQKLLKPFQLLMKAKNAVLGTVFGQEATTTNSSTRSRQVAAATLGAAVSVGAAATSAVPELEKIRSATKTEQTVNIEAPITIHATPNMDEQRLAQAIQKTLNEREAQARTHRRSRLFDEAES